MTKYCIMKKFLLILAIFFVGRTSPAQDRSWLVNASEKKINQSAQSANAFFKADQREYAT